MSNGALEMDLTLQNPHFVLLIISTLLLSKREGKIGPEGGEELAL